jgi:hypothetical protein
MRRIFHSDMVAHFEVAIDTGAIEHRTAVYRNSNVAKR